MRTDGGPTISQASAYPWTDSQRHLVAHWMRNLPTMTVLAERSTHRNMHLLLCGGGPQTAHHLWECPVRSHEWRPARQRLHTWLTVYVGPRASRVQGQLWDPAVLEQWAAAIAKPSLQAAHMGIAGPHDLGTEYIRQVLFASQHVWLAHAKAPERLVTRMQDHPGHCLLVTAPSAQHNTTPHHTPAHCTKKQQKQSNDKNNHLT